MKKIIQLILLVVTFSSIHIVNTNAEVYFTNLNGVQMTEEEYNIIKNKLSETRALTLTQQQFDKYIQGTVISSNTIYQEVISNQDGIISERYITEEEYNNAPSEGIYLSEYILPGNNINSTSGYIETSYKRLNVTLSSYGNNIYDVLGSLTWKKLPNCRSYDIFAFRTNYMSYSSVYGIQTYFVGNNYTDISYNSSSTGYNSDTNGAGFSMNLKDGSNITKYEMTLFADLSITNFNYSTAHVYTTYQHAQTDLTQAQSKSYYFSVGGLGDVVYFSDTTIRNKYDDMAGVHLTTPIP